MTLQQWTATLIAELTDAGFTVADHEGFPLATMPLTVADAIRLMQFKTSQPADRIVGNAGMLFVPLGTRREYEKRCAARPSGSRRA